MKRLLTVLVVALFVVVMFAGSALALPPGQCKQVGPPGQEKHCLNQGAPASDQHCQDIKSPTQRERCEAEANP